MNANTLLNDVKIDCSKSIIKFGEDENSYFKVLFEFPQRDRLKQAEFADKICDYNSVYNYIVRLKNVSDNLGIVNVSKRCELIIEHIQNEKYNEVSKELRELRITYNKVCEAITKAKQISEN